MIVAVISDTHDSIEGVRRAAAVINESGAEAVLHLGDVVAPFTLRYMLKELKPKLVGVYGNNDGDRLLLARVAEEGGARFEEAPLELTLAGRRLLLLHGHGPPERTKQVVRSLASSGAYDVVLYGHTHEAEVSRQGRTLVVNPGELHGWLSGRRSLALLDLSRLEVRVVEL